MSLLNQIDNKNILVIGDVMIDTYFKGEIKRISPEAPVPVFRKKLEHSVPGGAANVAANLVAAEQNVSIMSLIGLDKNGEKLKSIFKEQGINTDLLIVANRHTTEKVRFLAGNNQQVLRLDVEDTELLSNSECEKLLLLFEKKVSEYDLIILSDYMKGLLTYDFTQGILQKARKEKIPVIIDVKDSNVEKYKGAYLIKPNLKELKALTRRTTASNQEIIEASQYLRNLCDSKYVLTTCGARGMVLIGDGAPYSIESISKEVFDVTGAGDTTIAYLAACMVNGFPIRECVNISNIAGGIQVSKVGTSSVYWKEIREILTGEASGVMHKIIKGRTVEEFRKTHNDKKIVFTNGCFDILHIGHVRYLQEAAKLGEILVIGLNSDASVKRLKGNNRPVNEEAERAELLAALGFVDYIVIFEEDTPLELIKKIQPDVLVKGGDYSNEYVVGTDEVKARNGKLVLIPFVEGKSTTGIIEKIKK
ncbi:D-glycero-beta-D-manno-heptose 1-phosphate adenylyltransferase [Enterocloster sp. OA13]|uniref:D-glycero-beta-D-manno-heptose 1-phosphate adenylyltransferase n=1 Tax=Enterocloster sp. OA13 TaxID=2914161 RepID=UPI0004BC48E1|nr:D-glycero-beta-D-manno-heptose 1-phosphate adenylyltransferase [Enterocloster sp. OA13]